MKIPKKETIIYYIIILVATIIVAVPIFQSVWIETNDGKLHLLRILGVFNSISSGQIPPVIAPDYGNTWGYAVNLFYNPISTFGPLLLTFITKYSIIAIKVFCTIMIFLSGIWMHKFVSKVTGNGKIGVIAAILFITVPYYLSDFYIRGALAEVTALAFLPLLFYGLYNLLDGDKKKHYYIAIGGIGLILSHTITFVYGAIFSVIYVAFHYKKIMEKEIIKKGIINVLFIIIISAFFIIPLFHNHLNANYMIFEQDVMGTDSTNVTAQGLQIKDFFSVDEDKKIFYQLGIPTIVGILLMPFVYKKIDEKYKNFYLIFSILGVATIFMSTKYFPWIILPGIFTVIQFPWRMLGFAGFFISILAAINIITLLEVVLKGKTKWSNYCIIAISCVILLCTYVLPFDIVKNSQKDVEYEKWRKEDLTLSFQEINREYMPKQAYYKYIAGLEDKRDNQINILKGKATILNEEKDSLKVEADIETTSKITKIEFPFLYYLGYQVQLEKENGNIEELKVIESENGFVQATIKGEEKGKIVCEYHTPNSYFVGIVISIIGLILFIIYIRKEKQNEKQREN